MSEGEISAGTVIALLGVKFLASAVLFGIGGHLLLIAFRVKDPRRGDALALYGLCGFLLMLGGAAIVFKP